MIKRTTIAACTAFAIASIATSTTASSSRLAWPAGQGQVQVNISFNMQLPLAATDEDTITTAQRDARRMFYRLAAAECANLTATIALSCKLTNLNVSTQLRPPAHQNPANLQVNGNAAYAIIIRPQGGTEENE